MFAVSAAAAVVLTGGASSAVRAQEGDAPNARDRQFVMMVGQGNIAEIKASRLALQKSKDEGVRKVATMIVQQHSVAQETLKQTIAQAKLNIKVPNDTDPMHKREYRQLSRLSGTAFDKMYIKGQVRDHYKTIALFNKELEKGQNSHIQGYAQRFLPDIQTHTQHITAQAGKLGIPTATKSAGNMSMGSADSAAMASHSTGNPNVSRAVPATNKTMGNGTTQPPRTNPTPPPSTVSAAR
jgi:putative membrane protein